MISDFEHRATLKQIETLRNVGFHFEINNNGYFVSYKDQGLGGAASTSHASSWQDKIINARKYCRSAISLAINSKFYDEIQNENNNEINYIKKIIDEFGAFTLKDVQTNISPVYRVVGVVSLLVEQFNYSHVDVVTYVNGDDIEEQMIRYEELSPELISEIYELAQDYEAISLKTLKRIESY